MNIQPSQRDKVIDHPAGLPISPPVETLIDRFWALGPEFDSAVFRIEPPQRPLALLEELGPSPFERGDFPIIGFLATTYDRVSRYAIERAGSLNDTGERSNT